MKLQALVISKYEFNSRNPPETMPIDEGDINPVERLVRVKDNTRDVIADNANAECAEDLLEEEEADGEEAMIGISNTDEEVRTIGWEGIAIPSPPHVQEPHRLVPFFTDLEGNEGCEVTRRDSYRNFQIGRAHV